MAPYVRQYGGVTVRLNPDHAGVGRMLRDGMLMKGLFPIGEAIVRRAEATAPRSGRGRSARRTGKPYAESFGVVPMVRPDRQTVRVFNSNAFAVYIEYGNRNIDAHRTLRTAAGIKFQ